MNYEQIKTKEIIDEDGCSLGTLEKYLKKFMTDNKIKMVKKDVNI